MARLRRLVHLLRTDPTGFREGAIGRARARLLFRGHDVGPGIAVLGAMHLSIDGQLRLGARVIFLRGVIPTDLVVHSGGKMEIGENTLVNYGCSIEATQEVRLGARCMLASLVRIADSDGRRSGPVIIGDDVWIAHGAFIAPGVRIGNGAVVAAGSVVMDDVPAGTMAMGNPARTMPLSMAAPTRVGGPAAADSDTG